MHLRKAYNKKTGRTYLSIVHGYRENEGKSKSKVIKSLGNVDDLEKDYENPISHFTAVAKSMEAERLSNTKITVTLEQL